MSQLGFFPRQATSGLITIPKSVMGDLHCRWFVNVGFLIISIAYSEFWSGSVGVDCDGGEVINLPQRGTYGYSKLYDITYKIVVGMKIWDNAFGMPEEKLRFINTNGELVYKFSTHMGTHSDAPDHVFTNMSS